MVVIASPNGERYGIMYANIKSQLKTIIRLPALLLTALDILFNI